MEIADLRGLTDEELATELENSEREMMNLRFRIATMQLSDVNSIKRTRKRISRIHTIIKERGLARAEK